MKRVWIKTIAAAAALSSLGLAQAAHPAHAAQPIPGAGNWELRRQLPGVPEGVCTIRTEGPEANTSIILNDDRRPVMMVANREWSGLSGEAEAELSIDGGQPIRVGVHMVHNLVMFMPPDDQMLQRLRAARTLDWTLSFGRFRAAVEGLGAALDALTACRPGAA